MNLVEEWLSLLHFWIWKRYLILLIMPCCSNVLINCIFAINTEIQWFSSYLSDHFQQVKWNYSYFGWGPVLGGIPQGVPWDPSYFWFMWMICFYKYRIGHFCSLQMTLVWSAMVMIIQRLIIQTFGERLSSF